MLREKRSYAALYANRRAGWNPSEWHALDDWALKAGIKSYILTDIEELDPVIRQFGEEVRLLFIFGGDGTLFRVMNSWLKHHGVEKMPIIAPIGGGTMKRLPKTTLWNGTPVENAQVALELFEGKRLPHLRLPLLEVKWEKEHFFAVTFMAGAPVRVMRQYSRFKTTPILAGAFVLGSFTSARLGWPKFFTSLYDQVWAEVMVDGERLPHERFIVIIKDVLEKLIFFIEPYKGSCLPTQSFSLAYAVDYKEAARCIERLCIGRPPADARYFNRPTNTMQIKPRAEVPFTLDGEYFVAKKGEIITISQGPEVRVAVNPFVHLTMLKRLMVKIERLRSVVNYVWPIPKPDGSS